MGTSSRWGTVVAGVLVAAATVLGTAAPAGAQEPPRWTVPRFAQEITIGPCRPEPATRVRDPFPENGQLYWVRLPWLPEPDPSDHSYLLREQLGQRDLTRYQEPWTRMRTTYAAPYFHTTEQTQVRWNRASIIAVRCEGSDMIAVVNLVRGEGRVKTVNWNDFGASSFPDLVSTTPWPSDR